MGYMNLGIKTVGLGSGVSMGHLGYSHYGMEDIALLRSIPNITIISPADCGALVKTIYAAMEHNGPIYIRLTGEPGMPIVYSDDCRLEIGKANVIKDSGDIMIVATGSMVAESLNAVEELSNKGIECRVIDMHTLKPLDTDVIYERLSKVKYIITVEEHSIYGGLGSAVAECIAESGTSVKLVRMGLNDRYYKAGSYEYMKKENGICSDDIVNTIEGLI